MASGVAIGAAAAAATSAGVMPAWDLQRVRAIVREAVRRKILLFSKWRGQIGEDDLVQLAVERARAIHPKFDPGRGAQYTTWITRAAHFAIIDEWRRLRRRANGEEEYRAEQESAMRNAQNPTSAQARRAAGALADWVAAGDEAGLPGGAGGDDETLAERLSRVYVQAMRTFPRKRHKFDPSRHTVATAVAAVLLMRWRRLSLRGTRLLLLSDGDLRAALRMSDVPSYGWFGRAVSFVTENLGMKLAVAAVE